MDILALTHTSVPLVTLFVSIFTLWYLHRTFNKQKDISLRESREKVYDSVNKFFSEEESIRARYYNENAMKYEKLSQENKAYEKDRLHSTWQQITNQSVTSRMVESEDCYGIVKMINSYKRDNEERIGNLFGSKIKKAFCELTNEMLALYKLNGGNKYGHLHHAYSPILDKYEKTVRQRMAKKLQIA